MRRPKPRQLRGSWTHIPGREDVFALIDGQRERWRVGDIAELKRPDAEWIKNNSGIDIGKVRHVAWNNAIEAWVIHLHK